MVLRACKLPKDYEPGRRLSREAFTFELSSRDKALPVPKLSVYVQSLTSEAQACALVGDGTTHRLVARVGVTAIRQISVEGYGLNAVWDAALLDDDTPDTRPGADGHAGITGLQRPPDVARATFKTLQIRLADAVGENYNVVS